MLVKMPDSFECVWNYYLIESTLMNSESSLAAVRNRPVFGLRKLPISYLFIAMSHSKLQQSVNNTK